MQQPDLTLKRVIDKIKVQDQKVECAEAFAPLLQMAKNMREDRMRRGRDAYASTLRTASNTVRRRARNRNPVQTPVRIAIRVPRVGRVQSKWAPISARQSNALGSDP